MTMPFPVFETLFAQAVSFKADPSQSLPKDPTGITPMSAQIAISMLASYVGTPSLMLRFPRVELRSLYKIK